jgi:hypothetical protein
MIYTIYTPRLDIPGNPGEVDSVEELLLDLDI